MRLKDFPVIPNEVLGFNFDYFFRYRGKDYSHRLDFLGYATHVDQPNGQLILHASPKLTHEEKPDTTVQRVYDALVRKLDEFEWKMGRVPYTPYEFPVDDINMFNPHHKGEEISDLLNVLIDTPVLLEYPEKSVVGYMFRAEGNSVRLFSIKKQNFYRMSISDRAPFNLGTHKVDRCQAYELVPEFNALDVLFHGWRRE